MRRTNADELRRTISELLDQVFAVEHSMEIFQKKDAAAELERAAQHFDEMLNHVDRLGQLIAATRVKRRTQTAA